MKRKATFVLAILTWIIPFKLMADEHPYTTGIGYGFPNLPKLLFNKYDYKNQFESSGIGPFHLKFEKRVRKRIGLGANLNYTQYKISYYEQHLADNGTLVPNKVTISNWNTALNGRINFHFLDPDRFERSEFYFGLGIGIRYGRLKISAQFENDLPTIELPWYFKTLNWFGLESTLGYRHLLSDHVGFYAEAGIAKSLAQLGLFARF